MEPEHNAISLSHTNTTHTTYYLFFYLYHYQYSFHTTERSPRTYVHGHPNDRTNDNNNVYVTIFFSFLAGLPIFCDPSLVTTVYYTIILKVYVYIYKIKQFLYCVRIHVVDGFFFCEYFCRTENPCRMPYDSNPEKKDSSTTKRRRHRNECPTVSASCYVERKWKTGKKKKKKKTRNVLLSTSQLTNMLYFIISLRWRLQKKKAPVLPTLFVFLLVLDEGYVINIHFQTIAQLTQRM